MSSLVWVELDKSAPAHNVRELKKGAAAGTQFCAVVKSNAYGHGIREFVPLLGDEPDWFAVNSLDEGLELRGLGVKQPVILLGHVPLARLAEAVKADLRMVVYNPETISALAGIGTAERPARVHVKIETGTGRQGVLPTELAAFADLIRVTPGVVLEGASTHYANIEDTLSHDYAEKQIGEFKAALDLLAKKNMRPQVVHTACTAASILFPETHHTMLRAGIGLYGLWPSRETLQAAKIWRQDLPDLRPVLSWRTQVAQLKELPAGSFVGYGCSFRTTRPTRVGILPVGYADGYDRALGNRAHVLVRGKRAPVIGRVCMNLVITDMTDIPEAKLEDVVTLLGKDGDERITAELMAEWAGTINYEVVTRISTLLPRKLT